MGQPPRHRRRPHPPPNPPPPPLTGFGWIGGPQPHPTASGTRPACFDPERGFVDTAIYRRDDLCPGDLVDGPAVVKYGATVPLAPGFRARVDRFGNLLVTRHEEPGKGAAR